MPHPPRDLAEWSLHCFCLGARQTPHALVRRPPFGRLLFETQDWRDLASLRNSGVDATPESIDRLRAFDLLEVDGDSFRCAFPRLGPDQIFPIRADFALRARAFVETAKDDFAAVTAELAALGMAGAAHAVCVGHVLDGLLWEHLRARMEIPETRLTPAHPLWRGVFWAVYPGCADAVGTNEIVSGPHRLTVVWSPRTRFLDDITKHDWPVALLRFLAGEERQPPPEALRLGLVTASWRPGIPVFGDPRFAALATAARLLAERAATFFIELLAATDRLPELTAAERNVILAHELIWSIQAVLSQRPDSPRAPTKPSECLVAHIAPGQPSRMQP